MAATVGAKVVWADITYVVNQINSARTKHGLSTFSLTATTKPEAATVNTLLTRLKEANNKITSSTINITMTNISAGTIMKAQLLTDLYNTAVNVYNHCTCNSNCPCNCDYCSCLYACYCPCNCDYCSCLGNCSCDCNYCPNCPACPNCSCNCYNCPVCPQCPDGSCGCMGDAS